MRGILLNISKTSDKILHGDLTFKLRQNFGTGKVPNGLTETEL